MALKTDIQSALSQIRDQHSFFQVLLNRTLNWPITDAHDIEEIAFRWSWEDLRAADLNPQQVESRIWQVQPLSQNQPWGIFVLEFQNPDALVPKRGLAGVLRKVLRGLVASRRKAAGLPSWKREHLLFICTYDWQHFRFAYFRSKPDDPQASRLATFGWDLETSPRTVCEFNLPALIWPEDPPDSDAWISAWAKAFDKEPLTRDFFKRFDIALGAIKSDLEEHQALSPADAYSQAQLLLERLIFLYFMQNRGWLNQDQHYLRDKLEEHTAKPAAFTYYSEFLDKLFWTLSSAPSEGGRFPGIPFLNGGLFDDDEFRPGTTRKANPLLKVRNGAFQQVFRDLLEAFNFTVTEDTPLNQEVAVDPEMLGKVFESIVLHAEQDDPEANAPDKRKSTGSYYTPRIVVHFICREVLYQYLLAHLPGEGWGPRLKALLGMDVSDGVNEAEMKIVPRSCGIRGRGFQSLILRKLFEKSGEAYHDWNSSLPGYVAPGRSLGVPFDSTEGLREHLSTAQEIRERLRGEMIALQEEMDWLVYAAYGLLSQDHPAVGLDSSTSGEALKQATLPLDREQLPFRLWAQAEGDYSRPVAPVPADWPQWRKQLWEARLAAIRDNEHIRRIEQPVYKRRWDEQWKVKNQWRCGPVAYAAEFVDAFEWWLREKAE